MKIFSNNALLHPILGMKLWLRRQLTNLDQRDPHWDGGTVPPALERFAVGEILPWKGVQFRVGKIIGGDFPMVIIYPAGATHGAKLQRLRGLRDVGRAIIKADQRAKEAACSDSKAS